MDQQAFTGARAQVIVDGQFKGIFSDCSWGLTYTAEPVFILGRHSAAEIVYTSQEVVHVQARAWRVPGHGPHVDGSMPQLDQLLSYQNIELAIYDRQSGSFMARIHSVKPTGYSTGVTAKGLQEISMNFVGLLVDDESVINAELPSASSLP